MKVKKLLLLFLCIILFGCTDNKSPKHIKAAHKIMDFTSKELEKKINLQLIGSGGQMMHTIDVIHLAFTSSESLDINKARELLLSCSKIFINNINNFPQIQSYLHDFPATEKNISIEVYFQTNGISMKPPNIAVVGLNSGEIVYYYKYERLKKIYFETYEEGIKMVKDNPIELKTKQSNKNFKAEVNQDVISTKIPNFIRNNNK